MQVVPFLAYQEPKSRISWVFENGKHTLSIFGFTCTYKQEGQLNIFGILKFLSGQTHYLKKCRLTIASSLMIEATRVVTTIIEP